MGEQFIQCYHRSSGDNLPIVRLVVHATCPGMAYPRAAAAGEAVNTAHYFQSPTAGGSAHHVGDIKATVRCATDATICWHAPPNAHSLGYEIGGESTYSRAQWLSADVWPGVLRVAALIKADAAKYKIPVRKLTVDQVKADASGICGHVDVSEAFHQSDHTDPGPNFPWPEFMRALGTVKPAKPSVAARVKAAVRRKPAPAAIPSWYHQPLRYVAGKPFAHGADVRHVQQVLVGRGYLPAHNAKGASNVDSFYGSATAGAVEALQRHCHITADGVVGPDTARAIG